MGSETGEYESPKRRTIWLALGFAILIALGVVTVLLPELEHDADEESATSQPEADVSEDTEEAQPD